MWAALAYGNGALDESETVIKRLPILELRTGRGRRRTTYKVVAQDLSDLEREIEIEVSHSLFDKARYQGSQLQLTLKPGRFGFEWIVNKDVVIEGQD